MVSVTGTVAPTVVNGGIDSDTFTVGSLDGIASPLTVNGGGGTPIP